METASTPKYRPPANTETEQTAIAIRTNGNPRPKNSRKPSAALSSAEYPGIRPCRMKDSSSRNRANAICNPISTRSRVLLELGVGTSTTAGLGLRSSEWGASLGFIA
jgi:hypothetical protein